MIVLVPNDNDFQFIFNFQYGLNSKRCICHVLDRVLSFLTRPIVSLLNMFRQHNIVPEPKLVSGITHVALAFMQSSRFNEAVTPSEWPLFTTIEETREKFARGTSVMVAIGGWGDTQGFSVAAATDEGRRLFARNVKAMVDYTGADGMARHTS